VLKRRAPLFLLLLLSPAIAELLTSSSPPVEFFAPFGLVVMVSLYGSGALLVRELLLRWRKGWPSLLALGAAYGIIDEGLMVKSFFNPQHPDLGILGIYGRWGGVHWVWAVELTMFHAVFSIALPVLLVRLIFPEQSQQPWLGRRGWAFWSMVLVLVTLTGLVLFPSQPPPGPYVLALLTVTLLITLARWLPGRPCPPSPGSVSRPIHFWLLGLLSTLAFFFTLWVVPSTGIHPLASILISLLLAGSVTARWLRMSGNALAWGNPHRFALVAGGLSFYILLSPIIEFDQTRTDDPRGMTLVGLAMLLFLACTALRVRHNDARDLPRGQAAS
jgi:hypothetical protein